MSGGPDPQALAIAKLQTISRRTMPALWDALDSATRVAEANLPTGKDPNEWWLTMGHTAQVPLQVASLRSLVEDKEASKDQAAGDTICEIGFNAGHSAVAWLEATHARLVEFDLLGLPYSHASRAFVEQRYPKRATFHVGDSKTSVRSYAQAVLNGTASACDIWLVDGDHGIGAKVDLFNALASSHAGTMIVADDASLLFPYVRKFWRVHVGIGSIKERGCVSTRIRHGVEKTWCIGTVASWAVGEAAWTAVHAKFIALHALSRAERNRAYFANTNRHARRPSYESQR